MNFEHLRVSNNAIALAGVPLYYERMHVLWNPEKRHQISWFLALLSTGLLAFQLGFSAMLYGGDGILFAEHFAAPIGVGAAVADNGVNSLAAELTQKSSELEQREKAISAREAALGAEYRDAIAANNRLTIYVLSGVTLFLVILIALNFYLDYKRAMRGEGDLPPPLRHRGEFQTRL